MMTEIIENCCRIDAKNVVKSSLGGTLGLNFSSFGTGSRRMETGIWKMDVGIQKMSTGMWKMETEIRYPGSNPQYPVKQREEIDRGAERRRPQPGTPKKALFKYINR